MKDPVKTLETTPEFLIPLSRGKVKKISCARNEEVAVSTRVAGGKACGTNGVRIESKENPSKRAGANGKGMLAGRFDIITDALTNARVRRQENAKVGKIAGPTYETWLPWWGETRQRKTNAQKN